MRKRKSWQEKLADDKGLPQVKKITPALSGRWGKGTVVIPAPREVDSLMKLVPHGKVATINDLRAALARKHRATICCPITTGIFAWIAAHAAEEAAAETGKAAATPWWRTLKSDGRLNPKYPGGIPILRKRLAAEGHKITKRGANYFVSHFVETHCQIFQESPT